MVCPRWFAFLLGLTPVCLTGHTDINETIKALSAKIAQSPTADLLYERATEYRSLREKAHTLEDLRSALKLNPKHRPSTIALIEELGESDEALAIAKQLVKDSSDSPLIQEARFLLANVHHLRGDYTESLRLGKEIQKVSTELSTNTYLLIAENLLELKRTTEAAKLLKEAWNLDHSIVFRNLWIDISLTAGHTNEVLPIIEEELTSSRFRSSWLIRRARAFLILGKKQSARADLKAALTEITPRLNLTRPDYTLIADRGLIHALLDQQELAKKDLELLKKSGFPPNSYRLLTKALAPK